MCSRDPRVRRVIALHHRDRLDSAADRGFRAFVHNHVRRLDDRLQTGIAEAVHSRARRRHRQAGSQRRDARNVVTLRPVRLSAAENDFFDFGSVELRHLAQHIGDAVRREIIGAGHIERAAMRLGQRRPTAGDNDGFSHDSHISWHAMSADARPVRPTEQLDWERFGSHIRAHLDPATVPGLDLSQPMSVEQFQGGHSNLTYLLRFGDVELVLRRPPFGPVPPTAHDMARSIAGWRRCTRCFRWRRGPICCATMPKLLGAVFYVMERRRGLVIRTQEPEALAQDPSERRRVSVAMIDTLAALHRLDVERAGLSHLGKPVGFVERQVRGWTERWHRSKIDDIPEMESLAAWLPAHLPADQGDPPSFMATSNSTTSCSITTISDDRSPSSTGK